MCLAIPGKVVAIDGADPAFRIGKVDFVGVRKDVNLAYTPEAKVGDYVLVHVGFALNIVDEAEAQRTLATLEEMLEASGEAPG
jgi:hydrogenase expression/formation protein HypC